MHISLIPETIFHIGSLSITNTLLTAWLVALFFIIAAVVFRHSLKETPERLQALAESVVEKLLSFMETVTGDPVLARRFFPFVATIFLYVLVSNWAGILPGVGSIGFTRHTGEEEMFIPLFRSVYSDLNMTLALAILTVGFSHVLGVRSLGIRRHISRFITFKSPVAAFTGILEAISELAKVVSLAFRLFGNIFAGEVLLVIVAFLLPYLVPIPFLGLELFVGFIQALIFSVLAMVACSGSVKRHEADEAACVTES